MIALVVTTTIYADEDVVAEEPTISLAPYFSLSTENEAATSVVGNSLEFNRFVEYINLDMGLYITLNDMISIYPYMGVADFSFTVVPGGQFQALFGMVYAGVGTTLSLSDYVTINIGLVNTEYFLDKTVYAGVSLFTGFTFSIAPAFLDINIENYFNPLFNNTTVSIQDTIVYSLTFNFLNFIDERINTGLYIEGQFWIGPNFTDASYTGLDYTNEIFAGISSTPVEAVTIYALFAMYNIGGSDSTYATTYQTDSFGLKTGIRFTCEWFTAEFNYIPIFGIYDTNTYTGQEHRFQINMSIAL